MKSFEDKVLRGILIGSIGLILGSLIGLVVLLDKIMMGW